MSTRVRSRVAGEAELPAGRPARIVRFSLFERIVHWVVALAFIVLALTGLSLAYPSLFWLSALFGGGTLTRMIHPWAGAVFTLALLVMGIMWHRSMNLDRRDAEWLRKLPVYVAHRPGEVPPVGRFNAGQKLLFWLVLLLGAVEAVTGWYMWNPGTYGGSPVLQWSYLLHSLAATGYVALIVLHIYMGTLMLPGTFQTMTHGRISRRWAATHHALWLQEVEGRGGAPPVGVGRAPGTRR